MNLITQQDQTGDNVTVNGIQDVTHQDQLYGSFDPNMFASNGLVDNMLISDTQGMPIESQEQVHEQLANQRREAKNKRQTRNASLTANTHL